MRSSYHSHRNSVSVSRSTCKLECTSITISSSSSSSCSTSTTATTGRLPAFNILVHKSIDELGSLFSGCSCHRMCAYHFVVLYVFSFLVKLVSPILVHVVFLQLILCCKAACPYPTLVCIVCFDWTLWLAVCFRCITLFILLCPYLSLSL